MAGMSRSVLRPGEAIDPESFEHSLAIASLFIIKSLAPITRGIKYFRALKQGHLFWMQD